MSFSPDSKTLASASADKMVKLWDTRTGGEIKTLIGHINSVTSVSFSPDGKTLASASADKTVKLWDTKTGDQKTLQGHGGLVMSVNFNPDGKTLASASVDGTVKLWDTNRAREIKTIKGYVVPVTSFSFSVDGITGNTGPVSSVSFSPDGKTLASAYWDNTVKLWNFDLDNLLVRGCRLIRSYLQNDPDVSPEDRRLCDGIKR